MQGERGREGERVRGKEGGRHQPSTSCSSVSRLADRSCQNSILC